MFYVLDKTGTITEGIMQVKEVVPFDSKNSIENIREIASNIINSLDDSNSTFKAMKDYFTQDSSWVPIRKYLFLLRESGAE